VSQPWFEQIGLGLDCTSLQLGVMVPDLEKACFSGSAASFLILRQAGFGPFWKTG